jgi:hypothetical protein
VNGVVVLALNKPADVFIIKNKKGYTITIADKTASVTVNKLP